MATTTTKYAKGRIYKLNIADLQPDPNQVRSWMDPIGLNELTASIQQLGVLVPIQFTQSEEEILFIVSGHRRTRAAEKAGLTQIMGTYTDGDTRLQGFVDNLQRESLLPIDEAEQMSAMMKEYVINQYQLAESLGKGKSSVSETLTLNNLPIDIRDACRTNPNISKTFLLELAAVKSEKSMRRKFKSYMDSAGKAVQPTARPQRLSKQRTLIVKTDKLTGDLTDLPLDDWSEDDRNDLVNALMGIRGKAGELLNSLGAPPVDEEPAMEGELPMEGEPESPGSSNLT